MQIVKSTLWSLSTRISPTYSLENKCIFWFLPTSLEPQSHPRGVFCPGSWSCQIGVNNHERVRVCPRAEPESSVKFWIQTNVVENVQNCGPNIRDALYIISCWEPNADSGLGIMIGCSACIAAFIPRISSLSPSAVLKRRWIFVLRHSRTSGQLKMLDLWPEPDLW